MPQFGLFNVISIYIIQKKESIKKCRVYLGLEKEKIRINIQKKPMEASIDFFRTIFLSFNLFLC